MAEPKKRITSTRSGGRKSHLKAKAMSLAKCPKCQSPVKSHQVCQSCGFYNGTDVLELERKEAEKIARRKASEEEEKEK